MTAGAYTRPARETHPSRVGPYLAATGATLGVIAGLVELTVGPHIRSWVGDKQDTTRLGIATIALSAVALLAAASWYRRNHSSTGARLLVLVALLVPGAIGFTTVGRGWYIPGVLLSLAVVGAATELRGDAADIIPTISRHWVHILITACAAFYILLGATALGIAGAFGILGGTVSVAVVSAAGRIPKRAALFCLVVAVLPFAVLTWWSVASPLLAILIVALGVGAQIPESQSRN